MVLITVVHGDNFEDIIKNLEGLKEDLIKDYQRHKNLIEGVGMNAISDTYDYELRKEKITSIADAVDFFVKKSTSLRDK